MNKETLELSKELYALAMQHASGLDDYDEDVRRDMYRKVAMFAFEMAEEFYKAAAQKNGVG